MGDNGAVPEARNSIGNVDSLPPKTTFEWKNGAPNTAVDHPGEVDGTVVVHYPDGTSEEVAVKVNVKGQADTYAPQPSPNSGQWSRTRSKKQHWQCGQLTTENN